MSAVIYSFKRPEDGGVELTVVKDDEAFRALEKDWNELYAASSCTASGLLWEWQSEWWNHFAKKYSEPGGLRILTLRSSGRLVGLLPLYLRKTDQSGKRSLRFISSGENPGETTYIENLDLLYIPQYLERSLEKISSYLFKHAVSEWDEIDFGLLRQDSPLIRYYDLLRKPYYIIVKNTLPSPQRDLTRGSFELHKSFRRILKQEADSALSFKKPSSLAEALKSFEELVELHSKRWREAGELGAFGSESIISFHKSLIARLWPRHVTILTLSYKDRPLSLLYGFQIKGMFEFYQSGTDLNQKEVKRAGILAHLMAMRLLAANGIHTYDFLTGDSEYKRQLANAEGSCISLQIEKLTFRSSTRFLTRLPRRAYNKIHRGMISLINRI